MPLRRYLPRRHGRRGQLRNLKLNRHDLRSRARSTLRARDEITESKEKNPAAGRNAGKESGVYA